MEPRADAGELLMTERLGSFTELRSRPVFRVGRCLLVSLLAAAALLATGLDRANAADLKVSFAELTRLLQSLAATTRIYLNNVPGGLFANQSFAQVGNAPQTPISIPVKTFDVLGSRYGYYVSDVSSTAVRLTPIAGALRM